MRKQDFCIMFTVGLYCTDFHALKMNLSFKDHYFMMQVIMEFSAEMHQWLQTIEQ